MPRTTWEDWGWKADAAKGGQEADSRGLLPSLSPYPLHFPPLHLGYSY